MVLQAEAHIEQGVAVEASSNERPPQPSFHIDTVAETTHDTPIKAFAPKAPSARAVFDLPTVAVADKPKVTSDVATETIRTHAKKKPYEAEPFKNNNLIEPASKEKNIKAVTVGKADTKKTARDTVKDNESIQPPTKKEVEQELFVKPQKTEKKHSVPSFDVPVHAEPPKIKREPLPRQQPQQREVITQLHESLHPVTKKPAAKEIFVKPHEKPAPQAKDIVKKYEQKKVVGKERHQKPDEPIPITTLSKLQEIVKNLNPSPAEQKKGKQSKDTKKREKKKTATDKDQKDPSLIAVKDKDKIVDNKKAKDQEPLQPLATKTGGKEIFVKSQEKATKKSDKKQEKLQMKQQKDNTEANTEQKKLRKKRAQESDLTTNPKKREHGEESTPPTKIVVSEKIMDLVEQVMEQNDKAGDKRKQKRKKKDTVHKKDENRPSLSVVKDVVRNKEKITLSSQRKSPENDDQKAKKSEATPVTTMDELVEAFDYIKKLNTQTAPEKKQSKNTARKEKQKTTQVELPPVPKKKKQNADGTDPLRVTFSTNKEHRRKLTIDRREIMKLQLLLEKQVSDRKNHGESEVLIFNPKKNSSKEKNAEPKPKPKPKQRVGKETRNAKKQYVEIASDDKDLLIELEALKKIIKELQALQKKQRTEKNQGNEPITPDLSGLAPEELVQEDAQTQAADDISTLLHYQLLLLLLSLSEKMTYSDEIYANLSFQSENLWSSS